MRFGDNGEASVRRSEPEKKSNLDSKRVSKKIGEYIDYEEVDK
jgi:hypothetical protein